MTARTEPTVGNTTGLAGLFSRKKAIPQVKDILSGMTKLVEDLKNVSKQHAEKITGNNEQIAKLQADNESSQAEIAAASTAQRNLANLLGLNTDERPEQTVADDAESVPSTTA